MRTGNWLTKAQAEAILQAPDLSTLQGKRDRAMLTVLIGCGLRRDEAARLDISDIAQRDGRWCAVDVKRKHGRIRTVPMPHWAKMAVDCWLAADDVTTGRVFRGRLRYMPVGVQRKVHHRATVQANRSAAQRR